MLPDLPVFGLNDPRLPECIPRGDGASVLLIGDAQRSAGAMRAAGVAEVWGAHLPPGSTFLSQFLDDQASAVAHFGAEDAIDPVALRREMLAVVEEGANLLDVPATPHPHLPTRTRRTRSWRAVAADPPVRWAIDGLLPASGIAILAGEPGAGKTLLALDLALRLAHGHDWFSRRATAGSTLYLAGEGSGGLGARLRSWMAAHPSAQPVEDHDVTIVDGVPDLTSSASSGEVDELLSAHRRVNGRLPAVLVIDTLAMATAGLDENDSGAVGAVLRVLARVAARGILVLVVHHLRKLPTDRGATRSQHDLRGSSAVAGAADVVLLAVERDGVRELRVAKIRDGEPPPPIPYEIRGQVTGRLREDGSPELGPTVFPAAPTNGSDAEPAETVHQREHERDVQAVCQALRDLGSPASAIDQVVALAGIGKTRGRPAVRTAMSRGWIVRDGSARQPRFRCVCVTTPIPPAGAGRRPPGVGSGAASTPGRRSGVDRASGAEGSEEDQR